MKFALLGSDREALALARVVSDSPEHELTATYVLSEKSGAAEVLEALESPRKGEAWESALLGNVADAVIVGRAETPEQLDDPLRRLAQEGMPALIVHPACSSLMALELEMIRGDTGALLVPYFPESGHPAMARLVNLVRDPAGPLGAIKQVVFEHPLAAASKVEIERVLSRDAHLARCLLGEMQRVSGHGDPASLANLTVQLTSASGVPVRWSASPETSTAGLTGRAIVYGETSKAELTMAEDPAAWRLVVGEEEQPLPDSAAWNPAAAAVRELAAAASTGAATSVHWRDACRSLEITEAVERSLARSRTIELYHELPTEEATFKGMMAAGGCLLLMLALLLLVLVGIFGDGLGLRDQGFGLGNLWAWVVGGVLGAFTLMQLLRFVFPSDKRLPPSPAEEKTDQADLAG